MLGVRWCALGARIDVAFDTSLHRPRRTKLTKFIELGFDAPAQKFDLLLFLTYRKVCIDESFSFRFLIVLCMSVIVDNGIIVDSLGKSLEFWARRGDCKLQTSKHHQERSAILSQASPSTSAVHNVAANSARSAAAHFTDSRRGQGKSAMGFDLLSPVASIPLPTQSGRSTPQAGPPRGLPCGFPWSN